MTSCRKTGNHISVCQEPARSTSDPGKSFEKQTEKNGYTHCSLVERGGGNDITSQWEPRALELPVDSVPETVGFSSGQQLDPCAMRPDTRGSASRERERLSGLRVLGAHRQARELIES